MKSIIGMLLLFAALVIFIANDLPVSLDWAIVVAISGLAGYELTKRFKS